MSELPEAMVLQCDRDAAADYGLATNSVSLGQADSIRRGEWDDLPRVQRFVFYRNRLAAGVAEMRDILAGIKWQSADRDNMEFAARITYVQMDRIRAALQGPSHE